MKKNLHFHDALQWRTWLWVKGEGCEIFGKRHSNKMTNFLLIVHFHGTKSYQNIFLFLNSASSIKYTTLYIYSIVYYIYIVCVPQYPTRGCIETMPEYLEARSDKSILSNSICMLQTLF